MNNPLDFPKELSQDEIKFDIFLRTREVKELGSVLRELSLMPQSKKSRWLKDNGEVVQAGMDDFLDDSKLVLQGVSLDEEMVQLSGDLVSSMQETLSVMHAVFQDQKILTNPDS